jgi:BirA family biotin operon repressor/biotin-[acetyl-CoA-carboxylase] ligase
LTHPGRPGEPAVPAGYRLVALDEVDSTNACAARRHAGGETGPLWVWAKTQTAGRGRQGRHWVSKPGNLYATLLLSLDVDAATAAQAGFVAALAVHDVVAGLSGREDAVRLKWPNDVLLNDNKVAGILSEALPGASAGRMAIAIGCGINLAHAPADTRYGATSVAAEVRGEPAAPQDAFARLAERFAHWLAVWRSGAGFADISAVWQQRSDPHGHAITLQVGDDKVSGTFVGLTPSGAIVLKDERGTTKTFHAGEVIHANRE